MSTAPRYDGPPRVPLTDAELDKAARITPEDIEDAKAAWRRDAPEEAKDLLDAEPEPLTAEDFERGMREQDDSPMHRAMRRAATRASEGEASDPPTCN